LSLAPGGSDVGDWSHAATGARVPGILGSASSGTAISWDYAGFVRERVAQNFRLA